MSEDMGGFFYPNKRDKGSEWSDGITRRDWLAGLAMQVILADPGSVDVSWEKMAEYSYKSADAMIREGAK